MKYIVHFVLCLCYSNSYLTDGPLQFNKKFSFPRRSNDLNIANNAKEIETPHVAIKTNSPKNAKVDIKNFGKYGLRRQDSVQDSSTKEVFDFQDEFKKTWAHMQYQVLNTSIPGGDQVFMLAARPWGVPCGDPNQHDVPWGTCMLPMECDPDYRVYRGDYFCGRTDFICCGLLDNVYDLNAPFDISFAGDSFQVSSDEIRNRGAREKKKNAGMSGEKNKRKRDRVQRKKDMQDLINRILKEIRDLLTKAHKNNTRLKRKKTKQLNAFLKYLKNQYKKDRQSVMDIHVVDSIRIDVALRKKLEELSRINENFMKNETFRNIMANGTQTMTRSEAMMLMQAYPVLQEYLIKRRNMKKSTEKEDPSAYDVEYGLMYY